MAVGFFSEGRPSGAAGFFLCITQIALQLFIVYLLLFINEPGEIIRSTAHVKARASRKGLFPIEFHEQSRRLVCTSGSTDGLKA